MLATFCSLCEPDSGLAWQEEEELKRLEEEAERAREDSIRRKQEKKDRRCWKVQVHSLTSGP